MLLHCLLYIIYYDHSKLKALTVMTVIAINHKCELLLMILIRINYLIN